MKIHSVFKMEEGKNAVIKFYDEFLEKLTLSYEKLYVDTRYGKTFIIASGEKSNPPILLHDSGMNSVMWLRDIKGYSKTYRVYTMDMLGESRKGYEYRPLFFDDELKLLTMPTVLFVGAKDIMLHSDKTAKCLGNLLPHAQINILPKAGHSNVNDVDKIIEWFNLSGLQKSYQLMK